MAAIIKNNEVFIKSHNKLSKVNIPTNTITWYHSSCDTVFALKDRLFMNNVEMLMDNTNLMSLFIKDNILVRFFPKHYIMTIDGVDYKNKFSFKEELRNTMSITIKTCANECMFYINKCNYTISPNCITIRDYEFVSSESKFLTTCEGYYSCLWKNKNLGISYYSITSSTIKYIIVINNNPNITIKLEQDLVEKVISRNCILYDSKYVIFKDGETIFLDADEKPYLPIM